MQEQTLLETLEMTGRDDDRAAFPPETQPVTINSTLDGAEDDVFEGPDAFDFMMRDRSLHSRFLHRIQTIPCWIVSLSLHIALLLVLAGLTVNLRQKSIDDLVLDVAVQKKEPIVIDLAKIHRVFDPKAVKPLRSVPLAPSVNEPPQVEASTSAIPEIEEVELPFEVIPDDSFMKPEGDLSEAFEMKSGSNVFGFGNRERGNGGNGLTLRGLNGYGKLIGSLGSRLGKASQKWNKDILLIWLLDTSLSMKDDQAEIKEQLWEMDKRFRTPGTNLSLIQAVMTFNKDVRLVLKPTEDVNEVMKAFDRVKLSPPGNPENVMAAVIECTRQGQAFRKRKKVIILVDDDSADDPELLEDALSALQRSRSTLYVINRESPFQETDGLENFRFTDSSGETYGGTGLVKRGPETAEIEIPKLSWGAWNWPTNWGQSQYLSGFGIYGQSRLAYQSGGAYYILSSPKDPTAPEAEYDWDLMEYYRPELLQREQYLKRVKNNVFRKAIQNVERAWNSPGLRIQTMNWSPNLLSQNQQTCESKLKLASKLIAMLETKAILPDNRLASLRSSRRWPANADLLLAELYLAKYRLRQYKYALSEFEKGIKNVPEGHALLFEYYVKPKLTSEEARDRQDCIRAFNFVAKRHPRTPWGQIASDFDPNSNRYLFGFRIKHAPYFKPFMAIIEFKDGKKTEAKVNRIERKKLTYTNEKGTRTVPMSTVEKITPINKSVKTSPPRI